MNPDPQRPPTPAAQPEAAGPDAGHPAPGHEPAPIDLATESVAGEEDPGASIDSSVPPDAPVKP